MSSLFLLYLLFFALLFIVSLVVIVHCMLLLFTAYQPVMWISLFSWDTSCAPASCFSSSNSLDLAWLLLCPSSYPWPAGVLRLLSSVSSWGMAFWSICGLWVPYTAPLWLSGSLVSASRGSGRLRALLLLWSFCCFSATVLLQSCVIKLYTSSIPHCQAFVKWSTPDSPQKRSSSWHITGTFLPLCSGVPLRWRFGEVSGSESFLPGSPRCEMGKLRSALMPGFSFIYFCPSFLLIF